MADLTYHGGTSGKTLHAQILDVGDNVVDMPAGTAERSAVYGFDASDLTAAGVATGLYKPPVLVGSAAGHDVTDAVDGHMEEFYFDATAVTVINGIQRAAELAITAKGLTALTADEVVVERTFYVGHSGNTARNIITLNTWTSGTVTIAVDFSGILNEGTVIQTVDTAVVTNDATQVVVATTSLRIHKGLEQALFDVASIDATTAHTVKTTITTTDSQTLSLTGRLDVE